MNDEINLNGVKYRRVVEEYKRGDWVKIVHSGLPESIGKFAEVFEVDDSKVYLGGELGWYQFSSVVLSSRPTKPKPAYKCGDWVKVIKTQNGEILGMKGKITVIHPTALSVEIEIPTRTNGVITWCLGYEQVVPCQQFEVGDYIETTADSESNGRFYKKGAQGQVLEIGTERDSHAGHFNVMFLREPYRKNGPIDTWWVLGDRAKKIDDLRPVDPPPNLLIHNVGDIVLIPVRITHVDPDDADSPYRAVTVYKDPGIERSEDDCWYSRIEIDGDGITPSIGDTAVGWSDSSDSGKLIEIDLADDDLPFKVDGRWYHNVVKINK